MAVLHSPNSKLSIDVGFPILLSLYFNLIQDLAILSKYIFWQLLQYHLRPPLQKNLLWQSCSIFKAYWFYWQKNQKYGQGTLCKAIGIRFILLRLWIGQEAEAKGTLQWSQQDDPEEVEENLGGKPRRLHPELSLYLGKRKPACFFFILVIM